MKYIIASLVVLPLGFVGYLKATKQSIVWENGLPAGIDKTAKIKASKGIKTAFDAGVKVAEVTGGSKLDTAKKGLDAITHLAESRS